MKHQRQQWSRREALCGLGGLALGTPSAARAEAEPEPRLEDVVPMRGKAGPGMEAFDSAMLKIMDRHGIPGAALAVARNGKLVFAKGYGWSDVGTGAPVQPDTRFGLASVSKVFTAVAVLKLVEQKKISLDDPVFDYIKAKPPAGVRPDRRLFSITVRQCLNHSGGWDRSVAGDPINWTPQICRAFRIRPPVRADQFISFMMTRPLDFKPGTAAKYSNVGYIILGEAIARVSEQPYDRFVRDSILKPMGIKGPSLQDGGTRYLPGEAHRHLAGTLTTLPPMQLPMLNATGGWCASVLDLVRFLSNLDGSRGKPILGEAMRAEMLAPPPKPIEPRKDGTYYGLGWDAVALKDEKMAYFKNGSYQGMWTAMKRLPNGVNWALLYNASMEMDSEDQHTVANAVHEVRKEVDGVNKHPDVDLFKDFA